jgi:hypothetical protein
MAASTQSLSSTGDIVKFSLADGRIIELDVFQDPQSGQEHVYCDICETSISLRSHQSMAGFGTHRLSKKCERTAKTKNSQRRDTKTAAEAALALRSLQASSNLGEIHSDLSYCMNYLMIG